MPEPTFGGFLRNVRLRSKGTQLAKAAGISYVYLLDLEKGSRPVPSNSVLMALADNLSFLPGEREKFFDLAAIEKGEVPVDVAEFICENRQLVSFVRELKKIAPNQTFLRAILKNISVQAGGNSCEEE